MFITGVYLGLSAREKNLTCYYYNTTVPASTHAWSPSSLFAIQSTSRMLGLIFFYELYHYTCKTAGIISIPVATLVLPSTSLLLLIVLDARRKPPGSEAVGIIRESFHLASAVWLLIILQIIWELSIRAKKEEESRHQQTARKG